MGKQKEQEHIQDGHGKMQACTNLEYTKNKVHKKIANELSMCCSEEHEDHKAS